MIVRVMGNPPHAEPSRAELRVSHDKPTEEIMSQETVAVEQAAHPSVGRRELPAILDIILA
jgi:hypothetical protein